MHRFSMISNRLRFESASPLVVGSFSDVAALRAAGPSLLLDACDLAEIRLDLLVAGGDEPDPRLWAHLKGVPLLFTARRQEEGGAMASTLEQRLTWLETALHESAVVDLEVAILTDTAEFVGKLKDRSIPLVASFHDFEGMPSSTLLEEKVEDAKAAGADIFKVAARIQQIEDLTKLVNFLKIDHGIPKSVMGMGPLGPVSRLLCAQYGSVLNYGYLGKTPTAPGQWDAARLKNAVKSVTVGL
jgi:3-dehydroquinate dehydratase-1